MMVDDADRGDSRVQLAAPEAALAHLGELRLNYCCMAPTSGGAPAGIEQGAQPATDPRPVDRQTLRLSWSIDALGKLRARWQT